VRLYSGTFTHLRVGTIQQALAIRALDAGAQGIVFLQVQSAGGTPLPPAPVDIPLMAPAGLQAHATWMVSHNGTS